MGNGTHDLAVCCHNSYVQNEPGCWFKPSWLLSEHAKLKTCNSNMSDDHISTDHHGGCCNHKNH